MVERPSAPYRAGRQPIAGYGPIAGCGGLARNLRARRLEATAVEPEQAAELGRLRQATRTRRPCGDASFVEEMEQRSGRRLRPGLGGRPVQGPAAVREGDSHPGGR